MAGGGRKGNSNGGGRLRERRGDGVSAQRRRGRTARGAAQFSGNALLARLAAVGAQGRSLAPSCGLPASGRPSESGRQPRLVAKPRAGESVPRGVDFSGLVGEAEARREGRRCTATGRRSARAREVGSGCGSPRRSRSRTSGGRITAGRRTAGRRAIGSMDARTRGSLGGTTKPL